MKCTSDKIKEIEEHIRRLKTIEEFDAIEEYILILTHILEIQREYELFKEILG
jgi:hypothetical protein